MMPQHHIAVVALSGADYKTSTVLGKVWDGPSRVLDEDLLGGELHWLELDVAIEGRWQDLNVQGDFISSSLELELLASNMVPVYGSQVVMIRGASAFAAVVAALVVTNLLLQRGEMAGVFFLDYVQDWGVELGTAIDMVRQCP